MAQTIRSRIKHSLPVILFFVFSVCICGPISLFLSNAEEFWFDLKNLLYVVLPVSLGALLVLLLLAAVIPETKRHIVLKLFFGVALAMYVQGNYINIRYGSGVQDGSEILWGEYTSYAIWNTLAWIVCLAVPFIIDLAVKRKKELFYRVLAWASAFLIAIQIPAVVSQFMSYRPADNREYIISTDNMFEISESDNILVFILDTMDEAYYSDFIKAHPEYTEEMPGFIHYENAAAAGCRTFIAVPAMFTGTPFIRDKTYSDYLHHVWSEPNTFSLLHEAGYAVNVYSEDMLFSDDAVEYIDNFYGGKKSVESYPVLAQKVYKMDMFTFMPHLLKRFFWYTSAEFKEAQKQTDDTQQKTTYSMDDPAFFAAFKEKKFTVNPDAGKTLQVYHLSGAHTPYTMDEKGEKQKKGVTREQQVEGVFNRLVSMLYDLKVNGLYNDATIIVTTDHGDQHVGEYAMLSIKPAGREEAYTISAAPVSLFDLPEYITSVAGVKFRSAYGEDLTKLTEDSQRERHMFYNTSGNSRVTINEYVCSGFAGNKKNWTLKTKHEDPTSSSTKYVLGTELSFMTDATANIYTTEGFGNNTGFRTKLHGPIARMEIPVKDLPASGSLKLTINFYDSKAYYTNNLTLVANGQVIFEGVTDKAIVKNGLTADIPVDSFDKDGVLHLEMRFTDLDPAEMEKKLGDRTQITSLLSMKIEAE